MAEELTVDSAAIANQVDSIATFDKDAYDESQRPFWELKNVFAGIYSVVQDIMLHRYFDDDWAPILDGTRINLIGVSLGDPRFSGHRKSRKIELGYCWWLLKSYFGKPEKKFVTCAHWRKFVGINNAIANVFSTAKLYSKMRKEMIEPDDYFSVCFHEPIPLIGKTQYLGRLRKCGDYEPNCEAQYPYPL